jgi:Kelch motif.
MKYPRAMSAVAYMDNKFYTFGGYSGTNLNTCEKFNFTTWKWELLPNMPVARSAFTIAVKNNLLYMNGDSNRLDAFNTETNEFIDTGIILPEASYSSLVTYKDKLILIQNDGSWEINLEDTKVSRVSTIPVGKWWSCFSPYIHNTYIYLARYDDGYLWIYDLSTNTIVKKYKLIS